MRLDNLDIMRDLICTKIGDLVDGDGLENYGMAARIAGIKVSPTRHSREVHFGHHIGYCFLMIQYSPEDKPLIPLNGEKNPRGNGTCVYSEIDEKGFGLYIVDLLK